jgi:hypothetical protein
MKTETKEFNELIAAYMDCVFKKEIDGVRYYDVPASHVESYNASQGKFAYHKRWDWLMPVIRKLLMQMALFANNVHWSMKVDINMKRGHIERKLWDHFYYGFTIEEMQNEVAKTIKSFSEMKNEYELEH